jgi:hypothetical protein
MKQRTAFAFLFLLILSTSAYSSPLSVVNVNAPSVNCVFDTSCRIVVSDTSAPIPITAGGTNFLQSRTYTGNPGSPANGMYGYEYRIDLRNAVATAPSCIRSLTLKFGAAVSSLDYNGDGVHGDQVFVVTSGGIGSIGLSSANQDTNGNITFTFNSPVCPGTAPGSSGQSTYFFGLVSTQPPVPMTAHVTEVSGAVHNVVARAPQPGPACSIPPYSPAYWNDGGTVQFNNNCYNYGNNKRTDTFAQPGRAGGAIYSMPITCSGAYNAAVADGLVPLTVSGTCPGGRDKVALVVAPCVAPGCTAPYYSGNDYHWYRLGSDVMWSHKPGGTQATNLDNSHNPISNPETANRCGGGLCYSNFCGYLCSCSDVQQGQGHENIN